MLFKNPHNNPRKQWYSHFTDEKREEQEKHPVVEQRFKPRFVSKITRLGLVLGLLSTHLFSLFPAGEEGRSEICTRGAASGMRRCVHRGEGAGDQGEWVRHPEGPGRPIRRPGRSGSCRWLRGVGLTDDGVGGLHWHCPPPPGPQELVPPEPDVQAPGWCRFRNQPSKHRAQSGQSSREGRRWGEGQMEAGHCRLLLELSEMGTA